MQTEVARRKTKRGADGEARRLNLGAFDGQTYVAQPLDVGQFAVVLIDRKTADNRPKLTKTGSRSGMTDRDFRALAGQRSYRRMRGIYATFH